jgi:hypothetical protein
MPMQMLYGTNNKLTDDALLACQMAGVNPKDIEHV